MLEVISSSQSRHPCGGGILKFIPKKMVFLDDLLDRLIWISMSTRLRTSLIPGWG